MKIMIDIKTGNAAFEDNPEEISRIIERVAYDIKYGDREGNLRDSNGNTVGKFRVTGK